MSMATRADTPSRTTVATMTTEATFLRWRGHQLDPHRNSLNLIRLVLALAVILHHARPLGGFTGDYPIDGILIGDWAVYGFFCISGYLITGSRQTRTFGTYLKQRIARIYPAFWVCLLVTAVVIAPIDYAVVHGTLHGYVRTGPVTPLAYLVRNFTLRIGSWGLGDTLATAPYPVAWNGSLWTLYYEFLCYVLIAAVAATAWWRSSWWPAAVMFGASVGLHAAWPNLNAYFSNDSDIEILLTLLPFFLGGSLIHSLRRRLPLHWIGAAISVGAITLLIRASPQWGIQAAGPCYAYLLLWIGGALRAPSWFRRNDLSYGVYIYAFPVQQILTALGLARLGLTPYVVATVATVVPLAAASWFLVENPVMRRVRSDRSRSRAAPDSSRVEPSDDPGRLDIVLESTAPPLLFRGTSSPATTEELPR